MTLDDPLRREDLPDFAGGQRSAEPATQLKANEALELLNMEIREGDATTRRGAEALGAALPGSIQGLGWFSGAGASHLVACAGGALYRWDESHWSAFSSYTAASGALPVTLLTFAGALYIADGESPLARWDGAALQDLGSGGAGQPPVGSLLIKAGNRLWMAGVSAAPDTLYASKGLDAGSAGWDAVALSLRIGADDGDPITGLAGWDDNQVVVFKRNAIYLVRAAPDATSGEDEEHGLANAAPTQLSDSVGAVSHRSIAQLGNELLFLSEQGVLSLGRAAGQPNREIRPALSAPVLDVTERIHWAAAHQAAATVWKDRYLLSVPLDGSFSPNALLVYDGVQRAWSGVWTGWEAIAWTHSRSGNEPRLDFGRADGAVWRWLDYLAPEDATERAYQDAGRSVESALLSRALTFGREGQEKSAFNLAVDFFRSAATATVAVRLDGDQPVILAEALETSAKPAFLPLSLPAQLPGSPAQRRVFPGQLLAPFHTLQVQISASAQKLSVAGASLQGFLNAEV